MSTDFDRAWLDIQQRLMSGTLVRHWTKEEGYAGGAFSIADVNTDAVVIRQRHSIRQRIISKRDFEQLFNFWRTYNLGTISRLELSRRSEHSAYILSILQWSDETQIPLQTRPISSATIPLEVGTGAQAGLGGVDDYAKHVLHEATEGRATFFGRSVEIDYGAGPPARVDATVGDIAVEIEATGAKQVRGAVLDLICHPCPKKLLVLQPDHITNRGITAAQCRNILERFCSQGLFRVLVLKGSGSGPQLTEDAAIMAAVLADLRSM